MLLAVVLLAALTMIVVRARNADEALRDMVKRTVASLGMFVLILALLYNPAGTLLGFLTGWVRLLGDFDSDATAVISTTAPDLAAGTDNSVLTNFLRPLTWMLNYGSQLSPQCAKAWVKLIEHGDPITCLTSDQIQASQSVGTAFVMTLLALIPVWIYCRFALVVVITFATHLILAIVRFAAAGAMAAVAPWQDRPFDEFIRFMVSAVANLLVASGIVAVARLGPNLAVAIGEALTDSTLVQFAVLVLMYHLLSVLVWGLEKQFGPIRDWLIKGVSNASGSDESGSSRWWSMVFPGGLNPRSTMLDQAISRGRRRGSQWAGDVREQVTKMVNTKLLASSDQVLGASAASRETSGARVALALDTPESEGALAVINTVRTANTGGGTRSAEVIAKEQSMLARVMPGRQRRAGHPARRDGGGAPIGAQVGVPIGAVGLQASNAPVLPALPGDAPPQAQHPESGRAHWRQRLAQEAASLESKSAATPEGFSELRLNVNTPGAADSTFTEARGNALEPLDTRAELSAHLARICYMEVVMRAMGWEPTIDAQQLLPSGAKCFTSGKDLAGNWVTEFHS